MAFSLRKALAVVALMAAFSAPAGAVVAYDESVSGDLSNQFASPTSVTIVSPGVNQIIGQTGNVGGIDRDYFTIVIPTGFTLNNLVLGNFTLTVGAKGFLGIASGAAAPDPIGIVASSLVGYVHLLPGLVGTDILPLIGHAPGATGFPQTLVAGTYTFWVQDTSAGTVDNYTLNLDIQAPEPASMALVLTGLAGLGWARRRRALPRG